MIERQYVCPACGEHWRKLGPGVTDACPACGHSTLSDIGRTAEGSWALSMAQRQSVILRCRGIPGQGDQWEWQRGGEVRKGFASADAGARDAIMALFPETQWRAALAAGDTLEDYEGWVLDQSGGNPVQGSKSHVTVNETQEHE